ncbi:2-phosphoglycerate kinase [Bacillus carboniphilus]|uniref:2-phosphoglycerate kinase n=1 Tax=Bacillus carboniphilus TaxID=86663 RepID=A0ABY9JW29_9BACI|nr:2-phosphoglycerate kinase [Bacillus carboniphilus]WLR41840.1 2-phosphoglycerate kinase [Bacillus carboniphilus]
MAQTLLEKYKMPYLSIDHLKMGLYRGTDNCGFTPLDSDERIGEKLWPIVKGIIMTNIENNQSLIIEGCYLQAEYINELEKPYSDNIISVFLGFSTPYINENFTSNIIKHRNVVETRLNPEERTITRFIEMHDKFRNKCLEHGANYFEIDQDYEREIIKVYEFIEGQMQIMEGE